ncbi:MAG: SPOR domain-containing protein [Clostridia bacterium]
MAGKKEEDVDTLKRRGRRRLVGAVALVLLAVIVLPMVFDPEPRRAPPPVSVRIPGEDDSAFTPKVTPKPPPVAEKKSPAVAEKKAEEPKQPPAVEAPKKEEAKKAEAPAKAEEPKKPEAKPAAQAERARAEAALANAEYIVPVGAFANPDPVIAKLASAKVKYYTEKVPTAKGPVTRVRAGPFSTKAEADRALEALKALGLKPGGVTTKS